MILGSAGLQSGDPTGKEEIGFSRWGSALPIRRVTVCSSVSKLKTRLVAHLCASFANVGFATVGRVPYPSALCWREGGAFRPSNSLALIAEFISSRDITGVTCARVNSPTLSLREKGRAPTNFSPRTERVRHPPFLLIYPLTVEYPALDEAHES
jgi:hypothetical protein